jgi:hypothetical protein
MSFLALPLLIPAGAGIGLGTLIIGVFSSTPNSLNGQHSRVIWVTTNIKELNHLASNRNIISILPCPVTLEWQSHRIVGAAQRRSYPRIPGDPMEFDVIKF